MSDKHITNNFNAPIYNYGTIDGDIINPVYNDCGKSSDKPQATAADAPDALQTDEARALFGKAKEHGWVDEQMQPLVSQPKAAILASVMSDKLELSPRWASFEKLWGIPELANKLSKAQLCNYYSESLAEFEAALT